MRCWPDERYPDACAISCACELRVWTKMMRNRMHDEQRLPKRAPAAPCICRLLCLLNANLRTCTVRRSRRQSVGSTLSPDRPDRNMPTTCEHITDEDHQRLAVVDPANKKRLHVDASTTEDIGQQSTPTAPTTCCGPVLFVDRAITWAGVRVVAPPYNPVDCTITMRR